MDGRDLTITEPADAIKAGLAYVPEARVGDYVLVHAGFALTQLDEDQAHQTLETLKQLAPRELEGEMDRGGPQ